MISYLKQLYVFCKNIFLYRKFLWTSPTKETVDDLFTFLITYVSTLESELIKHSPRNLELQQIAKLKTLCKINQSEPLNYYLQKATELVQENPEEYPDGAFVLAIQLWDKEWKQLWDIICGQTVVDTITLTGETINWSNFYNGTGIIHWKI